MTVPLAALAWILIGIGIVTTTKPPHCGLPECVVMLFLWPVVFSVAVFRLVVDAAQHRR